MSKKYSDYINGYRAQHYKRVPLDLDFETYNRLKQSAVEQSMSVNGLLKYIISKYLDHYDKTK